MTPRQLRSIAFAAGLLGLAVCGCQTEGQDPQVLAVRDQYVSATEPAGAVTLTELARRLDGKSAESTDETSADESAAPPITAETPEAAAGAEGPAVVVGRVYAGDLEPWDPGKASFLLAELPAKGHGEGHDADNCPFCKRRAAQAPTAIVRFLDDRGEVIAKDARALFALQKNDVVTVSGQASRGELNTLILTADAIYVHRN